MELVDVIIQTMGLGPGGSLIALVIAAAVRAAAATLSKNVPDSKLGKAEGIMNLLGGNGKYASNK